jgi:hypothetical protein
VCRHLVEFGGLTLAQLTETTEARPSMWHWVVENPFFFVVSMVVDMGSFVINAILIGWFQRNLWHTARFDIAIAPSTASLAFSVVMLYVRLIGSNPVLPVTDGARRFNAFYKRLPGMLLRIVTGLFIVGSLVLHLYVLAEKNKRDNCILEAIENGTRKVHTSVNCGRMFVLTDPFLEAGAEKVRFMLYLAPTTHFPGVPDYTIGVDTDELSSVLLIGTANASLVLQSLRNAHGNFPPHSTTIALRTRGWFSLPAPIYAGAGNWHFHFDDCIPTMPG